MRLTPHYSLLALFSVDITNPRLSVSAAAAHYKPNCNHRNRAIWRRSVPTSEIPSFAESDLPLYTASTTHPQTCLASDHPHPPTILLPRRPEKKGGNAGRLEMPISNALPATKSSYPDGRTRTPITQISKVEAAYVGRKGTSMARIAERHGCAVL